MSKAFRYQISFFAFTIFTFFFGYLAGEKTASIAKFFIFNLLWVISLVGVVFAHADIEKENL